ncbi:MAG: asparagine synthase-related protein [Pseudomonadota bacterium]
MFAFLYNSRGSITFDRLQRAYTEAGASDCTHRWISPKGDIATIQVNATLLSAQNNTQPQSGESFVLAHGRLDAPEEIRRRLHANPATGDSHLIALAALNAGEAAPDLLPGDFAFAYWTGRSLFIAVDHIGQRSLYYTRTKYGFAVATRLPLLLALPDIPLALNAEGLALLTLGRMGRNKEDTAFAEIKLLPGSYCKWLHTDRETDACRWWNPDIAIRRNYKDPRDYTAELAVLFDNAVRCRLPEEGPAACTLSGGLDSTLVAGFAAPILARNNRMLHAWTSVPHPDLIPEQRPGWDSSDWSHACEMAELHANIQHQAVSPQGVCLLDTLHAVHKKNVTPVRNGANHFWLTEIALRARQAGCSVVLTGMRGNGSISFAGADGVRRIIRQVRWRHLARHVRNMPGNRGRYLLRSLMSACVNEHLLEQFQKARVKKPPPPGFPLVQPVTQAIYQRTSLSWPALTKRVHWADFMARPNTAFAADFLAYADVEIHDPTGDRRLHEYLLNCPPEAFVGDGFERLQARLLGAGKVPESIRWRRSRGEQVPEKAGFFGLYPERYREAWNAVRDLPWTSECINISAVDRALNDFIQGRRDARFLSTTLHRILDVGLFIIHAQNHWNAYFGQIDFFRNRSERADFETRSGGV